MVDLFRGRNLISQEAVLRSKLREVTRQRDELHVCCQRQLKALEYFKKKVSDLEAKIETKE